MKIIKAIFKFIVRGVLALIALFFFLVFAVLFLDTDQKETTSNETSLAKSSVLDIIEGRLPLDSIITQSRAWQGLNDFSFYSIEYATEMAEIQEQTLNRSIDIRPNYSNKTRSEDYWSQVYNGIYKANNPKLTNLKDSLTALREGTRFTKDEFANLIVSLVQDMPYWYVFDGEYCDKRPNKKLPCIDHVKFGLLSPSEMAATAIGDCDTRTLLLYVLLRHFNYDPIILVSDKYGHAMLGIDLPSTGDYKTHRGRKFYFWETTARGWKLGELPPDNSVIKYWKVALTFDV